ncbi:MAG: hypothetical protein WCJ40_08320, partial [Planctomycetota bacterium]
ARSSTARRQLCGQFASSWTIPSVRPRVDLVRVLKSRNQHLKSDSVPPLPAYRSRHHGDRGEPGREAGELLSPAPGGGGFERTARLAGFYAGAAQRAPQGRRALPSGGPLPGHARLRSHHAPPRGRSPYPR